MEEDMVMATTPRPRVIAPMKSTGGSGTRVRKPKQVAFLGEESSPRPSTPPPFSTPKTPDMSLFGNLGGNNKPAGTGGLFGAAGSTPAAGQSPAPSLFGAPQPGAAAAAAAAPSSGGLFGAQQQQNNKPSLSLFGNNTAASNPTTQPTSTGSNLFGGASNPTQQPATAAPSLFGGANTTGANLFASTNNASAPSNPQQSAFGANNQDSTATAAQQEQNARPVYFDNLIERNIKRQGADAGQTARMGAFGELPTLQLGLGDIQKKVRGLGQQYTPDSKAHYLLAASGVNTGAALRDLNLFTNSSVAKAPAPIAANDPLYGDLDSYVESLYQKEKKDLFDEFMEDSKRDFDRFIEDNLQCNWEQKRKDIYEHFGITKKSDKTEASFEGTTTDGARGAFGRSSRRAPFGASAGASRMGSKSVLGATGRQTSRASQFTDVAEKAPAGLQNISENRMLRDKQDKYSSKVKELNIARIEGRLYPLLHNFVDVEAQPSAEDTSKLVDAYKALADIVGESPDFQTSSDPRAIKERHFAQDYLDDAPNSRNAFDLRKRIIDGSRRFLEKQFLGQLETAILKNAKEAALGGVPSVINKVRAYVRLRAARKELGPDTSELQMINDDYPWVLIFYLLRAGLVNEAAEYVADNERAIKACDRNFPLFLASYARSTDRRLPQELQTRINNTYSQRAQFAPENSVDPYRMACFKIIGRCELGRRTLDGINQNMEDWVWLQFALAREVNRVEETASEVFGLDDVRSVIHEVGQRHFVQGAEGAAGYGTYFFLQILAGQFESAIAWLYPNNYLSAVHFAIALNYYGLLRVNDYSNSEDLLSYTTSQRPQISFAHLVGYYTKDFRAQSPTTAADYIALICLNGDLGGEIGQRQVALCHDGLRELVLETREFAQLLGDIRSDGQRIPGSIEQRLKIIRIADEKSFLRYITISAAQIADDNGRVTDAVLLYHLAEEYDNVITICNKALSEAISVELGDAPLRLTPLKPRESTAVETSASLSLTAVEDPYTLTRNMRALYESNQLHAAKIKQVNRESCTLLLGMAEAKSLVAEGRWALALDALNSLNCLPISAGGNMSLIRASANAFSNLPPPVARNIGNLLIWTITCCGQQREYLRSSPSGFEERGREKVAEDILQVAKDTMVFAGLIQYKLQPRVFEVLTRVGGDVGAY
jgi:nuclear pore complex protein Nup93